MKHKKITNHDNPNRKLMPGCEPLVRMELSRLYDEPASGNGAASILREVEAERSTIRQAKIWQGKGVNNAGLTPR